MLSNINTEQILEKLSKRKYYIMTEVTGLTHALFFFVFYSQGVTPMAVFNVFSPILYFSVRFLLDRKKEYAVFIFEYMEILIHGIVATWCVGWDTGFGQYLIALVPLGFTACYELMEGNKRITIASLLGLAATFSYILCRQFSYRRTPPYPLRMDVSNMLFTFNSAVTFAFLFFFLIIYMFAINEMESRLKKQNSNLGIMASTDPLTNLYNRRSMGGFLKESVENGRYFCVAMCDIDDFKRINDSYGHEAGDLVLKEVSRIIKEVIPEMNPICRWGGEEILILFNEHTKEEAVMLSDMLRRRIEANYIPFYNKTLHVTLTVGVAAYDNTKSIEETISEADSKLYYGKKHGKNQVVSVIQRV